MVCIRALPRMIELALRMLRRQAVTIVPMTSDRNRQLTLTTLTCCLLLGSLWSLAVGAVTITPGQIAAIIVNTLGFKLPWAYTEAQQAVLLAIRLPRLLLGVLVGAVLAVSGAAVQGLFRNPMADPALIGISSGAALAAVAVIVLNATLPAPFSLLSGRYGLPLAAFIGGFAGTSLVYRFATVQGRSDMASLLLAGIAVNALAGAATGLLTYLADDAQLRSITFWSMGSFGGATWNEVLLGLPFFLLALGLLPLLARALNALLLGEAEAMHLGFSVETVKTLVIALVALGVGASVALAGIIGFVGLLVPHLLRLALGPDHRLLLPGSALLGANLLLLADLCARTWVVPAEIPIGILTALLGAPCFLYLLRKQQNGFG